MINVGSDFSGVGSFNQALNRLGIDYKTIFACDNDKYARQTYVLNYGTPDYFPEDVYDREIPKDPLDIYMTSPPCQGFSMAGKRKGSILFYNSLEFIRENQPRFFIFENVKGLLSHDKRNKKSKYGKTFQTWINLLGRKSINNHPVIFPKPGSVKYHIHHKVLNAKYFDVPQKRERVFIIGIRDDVDNNFVFPSGFGLTKKNIKSIKESNVDKKYFLSDKMIAGFIKSSDKHKEKGTGFVWVPKNEDDIANCIRANAALGKTDNSLFLGYINQDTQASKVYDEDCISPTITSGSHGYANGYVKIKTNTKLGYDVFTENDTMSLDFKSCEKRRVV